MFAKLFFIFAVLPILEIALLINVGEQIGGWNTVAIVIVTAFVGASLVRQQGVATLFQAQTKMSQGQMPGQEMAEGLLLVIAGVLLVTPGFITDGIGLLFTLPMTRPRIASFLMKHIPMSVAGNVHASHNPFHHQQHQSQHQGSNTFEGEFERKDDEHKHIN